MDSISRSLLAEYRFRRPFKLLKFRCSEIETIQIYVTTPDMNVRIVYEYIQ